MSISGREPAGTRRIVARRAGDTDGAGDPDRRTGGDPVDRGTAANNAASTQKPDTPDDTLDDPSGVDARRRITHGGRKHDLVAHQEKTGGAEGNQHMGAKTGRSAAYLALEADKPGEHHGRHQANDHVPDWDLGFQVKGSPVRVRRRARLETGFVAPISRSASGA